MVRVIYNVKKRGDKMIYVLIETTKTGIYVLASGTGQKLKDIKEKQGIGDEIVSLGLLNERIRDL